jgi:peroxiredoxin
MISKNKSKSGTFNLRKLRGDRNIILFYTEGCEMCKGEKAAIRELIAQDVKMRAIFVNVDQIMASDPSLADKLFESFDLSSLPYIILTDRKGVIARRYLSYR